MTKNASAVAKPRVVLVACLAVLFHGAARPALPSAQEGLPASAPANVPAESAESADGQEIIWNLPPLRLGGTLSYGLGRDSSNGSSNMHSGLTTTVNASTSTFLWQPWFARLDGGLGFTKSSDSSGSDLPDRDSRSESVVVTGSGRLSVLSQSKFPFEAHFDRNNNRVTSDFAGSNGDSSQRYGFTQRHFREQGEAMFGWDRSTQSNVEAGGSLQDSLQLELSHNLEGHQFRLQGNRSTNRHDLTGENASQDNLSGQHNYTPDPEVTVLSTANVSRSELNLQQSTSNSLVTQLGSNVFWRPDEQPVTVNGGVRVMALGSEHSGFDASAEPTGSRFVTVNANAGVNYEYNRFTRINAAVNASSTQANGVNNTQTSQSVGANYQPDGIDFGTARYSWGTSANVTNQGGSDHSERGITLQISHSLSKGFALEGGSSINMDVNQGLSANASSGSSDNSTSALAGSHRQLVHGGAVSWDLSRQAGTAQVRLSASDSRALEGNEAFFQLVNLQASSSLPVNGYSSWVGSLTLQAMRQGQNAADENGQTNGGVVSSASGQLSYQTQRFLGYRNLRFGSDVRLNIQSQQTQQAQQTQQSSLSVLDSRTDQEAAAWTNRVDYSIGRTQLRVSAMVSRTNVNRNSGGATASVANGDGEARINRSVNLSVSRSFGMF